MVARDFFLGGVSRLMVSIPVVSLLLDCFAVFFAAVEAVDLLEVLAVVFLMVSLLSLLSLLVAIVVEFALLPLVSSWLLSGDSKRKGWGVRIISNNKVVKIRFLIPCSFLWVPLTVSSSSCSWA